MILSFALDWLASGGSPLWFHAVTITWHAIASTLVAASALAVMGPVAALVAGLLFAVHPVHVEAVASVVGRAEAMAGAGVLVALLLHRRGSVLAIPAFLFALLSKEHALVFPLLALVHDRVLDPPQQRTRLLHGGYVAIGVVWLAVVALLFHDQPFSDTASRFVGASVVERLPTVLAVVPHYVRLLAAPFSLSGDYEPQVIPEPVGITGAQIAGVLTLVAGLVALIMAWRRAPKAAFALAWIPVTIAPVSNVLLPTGVTLAERTRWDS